MIRRVIKFLDGSARRERIEKLEREIVTATIEASKHKSDPLLYPTVMERVHALQYKHLNETGRYFKFGVYRKMGGEDDVRTSYKT